MTTMLARWPGRCRRCGKPILVGQSMDWVKGAGATHPSLADCETAATAPPLRGPQPEDPEDRMNVVELLLAHPWKSATSKRYEKLPHQYTLRKQWADDEAFLWVVSHIRATGYERYFIGRIWVYYDIGEMQYWDCGGELHTIEGLNRAVRRPTACLLPLERRTMATTVKVDIQAILDKLSRGEVTLAAARAAFQAWLRG